MFVPAPNFRISLSAAEEWVDGCDVGDMPLSDIVASAFDGTALVLAGPTRIRPDSNTWRVNIIVRGHAAELKVRCDPQGRWVVLVGAWGVPV